MTKLIARRVLALVPTLLIVTLGVFLLVQLAPTDPAVAIAGEQADAATIAEVREQLGLDDPLVSQYGRWLGDALTGDLGDSYIRKTPVIEDLKERVPVTLGLVFAAVVFALILAVPLGILSGLRPNGLLDQSARVFSTLAVAVPSFLLGLVLVIVFAVDLGWLPPSGYAKYSDSPTEWLRYITLPAVSLGVAIAAAIMRQLRAALIDELDANHIRTAWAIGGSTPRVVGLHGLRNAAIPAVTILGLQVAALVGASVIVEQIFSIPGLGATLLEAIRAADLPAIQGCVLVLVIMQITISLAVDIAYGLLNPKVGVAA